MSINDNDGLFYIPTSFRQYDY